MNDSVKAKSSITLAGSLGLKPLDRVLINSTHEIREARAFSRQEDKPFELPWFYFQRVVGDKVEVRSPGGYACDISPHDICDVIPAQPITVRAMPMSKFLERISLPLSQRQCRPDSSFFSEAHVLHAEKGKFGRIDFLVWFIDESLNTTKPVRTIIEGDQRTLVD